MYCQPRTLTRNLLFRGFIRYWSHIQGQWHPTPVLLPGKSHGQRSLVGCSPWGRKESDTTERLHFHFSLSCIGDGNGNPLHCSCQENPRDREAWWAAVYGVAQSRTWLKWLSSSSSKQGQTSTWLALVSSRSGNWADTELPKSSTMNHIVRLNYLAWSKVPR